MREENIKNLEILYSWSQLYRNSLYQTRLKPKQFSEINKKRVENGLEPLRFPIINPFKYTDQGSQFREDGRSYDEVIQEQIKTLKRETYGKK